MKIRSSFVSNSSSSSYVCVICGEGDGGRDVGLSDVGMVKGYTDDYYCEYHLDELAVGKYIQKLASEQVLDANYKEMLDDLRIEHEAFGSIIMWLSPQETYDEYGKAFIEAFRYEIPADICPLEQLEEISDENALKYLLHKSEFRDMNHLIESLKSRFDVHRNVTRFIRENSEQ